MVVPGSRLAPLAVALIAATVVPRVHAQAPNERADLERFRDSLAATADSNGLLSVERRMIELAKSDRSDALVHLKLGFLSLRLGELGGQAHYDDAASEFQWAIDLQPDLALRVVRDGPGRVRGRRFAGLVRHRPQDHARQGRAHPVRDGLRQVGRGGSQLRPRAGRALQYRAAPAGQHQARRGARRAAPVGLDRGRRSDPAGAARPRAGRARGGRRRLGPRRVPRLSRPRRRAGASASSRSRAPCSCSAASTGCSRTTRARRPTTRPRSPATAPTSRRSPPTACCASSTASGGAQRVAYLQAVLGRPRPRGAARRRRTAARALPPPVLRPQELPAHLASTATTTSSSATARAAGTSTTAASSTSATASRRSRATYAAPGLEPNESWRYTRPEGDLIFHFVAREDVQDFKLVESLFDVLGFSQAVALRGDQAERQPGRRAAPAVARAALADLPAAAVGRAASAADSTRPRSGGWGRRASRSAPRTDSYELRFPQELKVRSDVLAVGHGTRPAPWCRSPTRSRGRASSR